VVKKVLADIHRYWFGDLTSPTDLPPPEKFDLWFGAKLETDAHIRDTFGKYLIPARETSWDLDNLSRVEQVGLVVLLDQFPRNIYRSTGDAFAYDAKALSVARELLKDGPDRFFPAERIFVALPFMHSENIVDQDYSVAFLATQLLAAPTDRREPGPRNGFDFAYKHWMIIRKFGRFPHRNVMLGRESTPEEIEFLKDGRGF
jgi:uncharacterized protein (DUF924 family)